MRSPQTESKLTHKSTDVAGIQLQARVLRVESRSGRTELRKVPRREEARKQAVVGETRRSETVGSSSVVLRDDIDGRVGRVVVIEESHAKVPGGLNDTLVVAGEDGHDRLAVPQMAVPLTVGGAMSEGMEQAGIRAGKGLLLQKAGLVDVERPIVEEGQVARPFLDARAVDFLERALESGCRCGIRVSLAVAHQHDDLVDGTALRRIGVDAIAHTIRIRANSTDVLQKVVGIVKCLVELFLTVCSAAGRGQSARRREAGENKAQDDHLEAPE